MIYVKAPGERRANDCGWCRPLPISSMPVACVVECVCVFAGEPDPCESPRCPSRPEDDVPPGAWRMLGPDHATV